MAMSERRGKPGAAALLDPDLFSHGRLLRRYEGSDPFRFSARSAFGILNHVEADPARRPHVLWDPFCGTGLISCVALFAFPGKFDTVVASDIDAQAVACARKNMRIFTEPDGLDARLQEIRRRQKINDKEHRRWGDVARYAESIRPLIHGSARAPLLTSNAPKVRAFVASGFSLPEGLPYSNAEGSMLQGLAGQVHFVADLPYGRMCQLRGGALSEVIPAVLSRYPEATVAFVLPPEAIAETVALVRRPFRKRLLKRGRAILYV